MTFGLLLVFVHISLMFVAVAMSYGTTLLYLLALRRSRIEYVRAVTTAGQPLARLIPIFFGLAGLAGLSAALVTGYNLLAPWLVISYFIFVVLTIIGAAFVGPRLERVGKLVATMPDGPLTPDVRQAATGGGFLWIELVDWAGLFLVIFVMVVKPFS